MRRIRRRAWVLIGSCLLVAGGDKQGSAIGPAELSGSPSRQQSASPRQIAAPVMRTAPSSAPATTGSVPGALGYYGGSSARAILSQMPRRTPVQAAPSAPIHQQIKPFQGYQADPTISPYLSLERQETADDVPNYFAFVRPQMQQMEVNQTQQREIQRLQRQLRAGASAPTDAANRGAAARFMDTAQFYGRRSR